MTHLSDWCILRTKKVSSSSSSCGTQSTVPCTGTFASATCGSVCESCFVNEFQDPVEGPSVRVRPGVVPKWVSGCFVGGTWVSGACRRAACPWKKALPKHGQGM